MYLSEKKRFLLTRYFMVMTTFPQSIFPDTTAGLQDYHLKCRLKQAENRFLNSTMRISEIADEPGFTAINHLSKAFNNYSGINPTTFRENYQNEA